MQKGMAAVVAGAGLILISGCLMLPVPTAEDKILTGTPVVAQQLAFLELQRTSKAAVIEHLGNPNLIWEDARLFVYAWDMRQGILFWAVGGPYAGRAGMTDLAKHYLLLIQFDADERVMRAEKTSRPPSQSLPEFLVDWNSVAPGSGERLDKR